MRLRSPRIIVDEIEFLNREHDISLFHFTDAVVNRPVDHFEAVMGEFIGRKLDVGWTGFFREDTLDRRLADLAKAAGLVAVYFSADALTDHGLKLLGKRLTKQDILRAAKVTAESQMLTMCHFLLNLPGDGEAQVMEAWEMLERLLEIHEGPANLRGRDLQPRQTLPRGTADKAADPSRRALPRCRSSLPVLSQSTPVLPSPSRDGSPLSPRGCFFAAETRRVRKDL